MSENKKRRRAYLDDFKKVGSKEYVWQGAQYIFEGGESAYRLSLRKLWAAAAAVGIAALAAGCIPAAGMDRSFYLLLPYMVQLVAAVSVVWTMLRISRAGSTMRAYIYEETVHKLSFRSRLTEGFAIAVLIGEVIFLVKNGFQGKAAGTVLFVAAELMAVAGGHFLCRVLDKMVWKRVENVEKKGSLH